MWNDAVTLICRKQVGVDSLKQPLFEEMQTFVLCNIRSVSRSEFYQASKTDNRPSLVIEMHKYEYDNQPIVLVEGKRYKVLKTYSTDFEMIELTLEEVL
ncbi:MULTISPECIES: phage head closure protein [unclassified Streptococcus]|uniref:phage head closure protein n=1 Tax=unclassified Streptococcus TaxID=2608887 RepID=UPI00211AB52E|nr:MULTISPECIES: phage head closure protein [unclassified Streptococcus]MCQ9211655.1 phage head closure protein [Streptococcus sp. B01]MCQ9213172.1 phage head closure protein [Streptococcus sp. O1]MCQ9214961.1 phage head closure protein [Streptococcus sp. O1]MCQ9215047.1 phage head closure protein [Streptococcus sp. O1]MCQ9215096.1 phage head closure protein [Streptococcus sp. O1]